MADRAMRSFTFDLALLTLLIGGVAYFLVDGLFGASGGGRIAALDAEIARLDADIMTLSMRRDALRRKVDGLSGDVVDADLFEETARATFGLGRADEMLILAPEGR